MKDYAIYTRVSTQKQGRSGLGLESQRNICKDFIKSKEGVFVAEFGDVESGTHRDRKGLADALSYCKAHNCALVFAKLDRLARDVEFCFKVVNTGVEIHFCDMPQVNTLMLGMFATIGQYERELTSSRTKQALAVKKSQGAKLGASNEKYRTTYNNKTIEERRIVEMKRGEMKRERYLSSRDVQAFLRILRNLFPDACESEDCREWIWKKIRTGGGYRAKIYAMMKDYAELDGSGTLFARWKFDTWTEDDVKPKLLALIQRIRESVLGKTRRENV